MKFALPHMIHMVWLVVIFAVVLYLFWRRRQSVVQRVAEKKLFDELSPSVSKRRVLLKAVALILVFLLSVIALARPQWGFEWQEVKRQGLDILVAIDVSKSMLAQDVKPTRLERVKLAVRDLVKQLKGDRIGLVAFAGQAFLVCPLTVDYNGFLLSLKDVDINTIPRGGTNVGEAIRESLKAYEDVPAKYKAVIIITDGDNLEGEPLVWAKKASEQGVRVYTVGVGTAEGELIRVPGDDGRLEYLKDEQGNVVKSRLNETLLQQIALETEGAYVRAGGAYFGLDVIYEQELSKLERREIQSKMEQKYFERFQIPLALALIFLVLNMVVSSRRGNA